MALALKGFEVHITLFAFDDDGTQVSRSKTFELEVAGADDDAKIAAAPAAAADFLADFNAITGAGIGNYRLGVLYEDDVLAVPTDNLYKEAVIQFALNATGSKKHSIYVPAPAADLLSSDGRSVDVASPQSQAFFDNFMATGSVRISDGESVRASNPVVSSGVRSVGSGKSY